MDTISATRDSTFFFLFLKVETDKSCFGNVLFLVYIYICI